MGLEQATGKYIGFVDPDDWLEEDMYEKLYEGLRNSPYPICLCNYYKDTKKRSSAKRFGFKEIVLDSDMVRKKIIPDMIGMEDIIPRYVYIMGCVWRGLFEREFIKKHNLHFEPGITIMEDLVFMVQALLKSNGVQIEPGVYYHYVQNPKSVLHSYNKKMWEDQMKVHDLLEEALKSAGMEENVRNRLDLRYIGMAIAAMRNETFTKNEQDIKERLLNIKEICTDDKLRLVLERVKPIMPSIKEDETESDQEGFVKHKIQDHSQHHKTYSLKYSKRSYLKKIKLKSISEQKDLLILKNRKSKKNKKRDAKIKKNHPES